MCTMFSHIIFDYKYYKILRLTRAEHTQTHTSENDRRRSIDLRTRFVVSRHTTEQTMQRTAPHRTASCDMVLKCACVCVCVLIPEQLPCLTLAGWLTKPLAEAAECLQRNTNFVSGFRVRVLPLHTRSALRHVFRCVCVCVVLFTVQSVFIIISLERARTHTKHSTAVCNINICVCTRDSLAARITNAITKCPARTAIRRWRRRPLRLLCRHACAVDAKRIDLIAPPSPRQGLSRCVRCVRLSFRHRD